MSPLLWLGEANLSESTDSDRHRCAIGIHVVAEL
jgi:hypothetical protein